MECNIPLRFHHVRKLLGVYLCWVYLFISGLPGAHQKTKLLERNTAPDQNTL